MKTRFLVSSLPLILLAGTLVRFVPQPRTSTLVTSYPKNAYRESLVARLKQTSKLFRAGDFRSAALLAEQGSRDALRAGEPRIGARFLGNAGGCRFALHQYREALRTYLEARRLAESVSDRATAGQLDFNISSLYAHLGQIDAATAAIDRAMMQLSGPERVQQLPKLMTHLAALQADQEHLPQAVELYRQAIAAAGRAGDPDMYAFAWNDLGYVYLDHGQLPQAERALLEAYRVRRLNHLRLLESSYENLGMLRASQGDTRAASSLLDRAVALSAQPGGVRPNWIVYYARGCVRLQRNRLQDALNDLRIAARLARTWRRAAFPDDATRMSAENKTQKVYSALLEAGNRLYFINHASDLARETFESAEANRAASLRVTLAEPRDWRRNLPAEYWETLQKLEAAEMELPRAADPGVAAANERIRALRGVLIQFESRAGSNTDVELPGLLENTRRKLGPDSAYLAFHLGSPDSYLWALSRETFALYRLPPGPEISALAVSFTNAVRQRDPQGWADGEQVYRLLFGRLDPIFQNKPRWLLALDAQLFQLPFAALVVERRGKKPVYLAERHSLQITAGAGMLAAGGTGDSPSDGPFVGVADPVYNMADPRWRGARPLVRSGLLAFFAVLAGESPASDDLPLARLAGSAREVADCAAIWRGAGVPILLEGSAASRPRLQSALQSHPSVLHFATHILRSGTGSKRSPEPGMIALSLTPSGQHEVLGPVEIATWNLRGALVVLSGCSSGSADALPATGLIGLIRASEVAGARAVVASQWPTPDDDGALFRSFYRYLRAAPTAGPAAALQHTQIDMLRSGTWRSNPLYWGAYFVTGSQP